MTTVHVVSFEPNTAQGGVGGFQWFPAVEDAEKYYNEGVSLETESGTVWSLWDHETDFDTTTQRYEITAEIDDLWGLGWPPDGKPRWTWKAE